MKLNLGDSPSWLVLLGLVVGILALQNQGMLANSYNPFGFQIHTVDFAGALAAVAILVMLVAFGRYLS